MPFIPDTQSGFVPDKPSTLDVNDTTHRTTADIIGSKALQNNAVSRFIQNATGAVVEPALKMVTGFAAKPVGEAAGLATMLYNMGTGNNDENAPAAVRDAVQHQLTYQPRTAAGQSEINPGNLLPYIVGRTIEAFQPDISLDPSSFSGMVRNAAREAVPQAANIFGTKYAPTMASKVADTTGNAAAATAGFVSGKGSMPYKEVFKAAEEGNPTATANMRGNVPVEQMLTDAKQGLLNIRQANDLAYKEAKTGWAADKTKIDIAPIETAFNDLNNSLYENGHSIIGTAERAKINEVKSVLNEWKNDPSSHTTVGLDALKKRLDAIYPDSPMQSQAQRVVTGTRNAVKDTIVQQAHDYAEAMKSYEEQLSTIRDIEQSLSLSGKSSKETALTKIMGLSMDKKFRQDVAEQLKQGSGIDLMPAAAGQAVSSIFPSGMVGRFGLGGIESAALFGHNPYLALAGTLSSPRLLGESANAAGHMARLLKQSGAGPALARAPFLPQTTLDPQEIARQLREGR